MNLQLIWDNLVSYSMQIGLLVGLAAFIPAALRLRLPASRLAYWHILLAACLLLPALRPWKQAAITLTRYVPTPITASGLPARSRRANALLRQPVRRTGWSPVVFITAPMLSSASSVMAMTGLPPGPMTT